MIAFYDLSVSPVSFDICQFLVCAKAISVEREEDLHVVIVPGRRENDPKPITDEDREFRTLHILVPAIRAIGATYTLAPSRMAAQAFLRTPSIFPIGYTVEKPVSRHVTKWSVGIAKMLVEAGRDVPGFSASARARQYVKDFVGSKPQPIVTIGLRETHTPTRNSDVKAWLAFGRQLRREGFRPVIVPDTEKMTKREDYGFETFPLAACDLDMRIALYDAALCNASRNNGPMVLNIYSRRPYLCVGMLSQPFPNVNTMRLEWAPTAEFMAAQGLPEGSQYPHATPLQMTVWEDDTEENIGKAWAEWRRRHGNH